MRFRRTRAFCAAFMLTLCLLLFGGGLLAADVHTRRMVFGSAATVPYAEPVGDRLLAPYEGIEPLWRLLPARWRAVLRLTEAETAAIVRVWETVDENA